MAINSTGEQRVDTAGSYGFFPDITALSGGGWVVAWQAYENGDDTDKAIIQQRYAPGGVKVGGEIQVSADNALGPTGPHVQLLADGGWIATWTDYTKVWDDGYNVIQQRYSSSGIKVGSEARVNTTYLYEQTGGHVSALEDGGWVVTWDSHYEDDGGSIYQQRYDAAGHAVDDETRVNVTIGHQGANDSTALAGGGWVVVWADFGVDEVGYGIHQRIYDLDGVAVSSELTVNTTTGGPQRSPSVAAFDQEDGGGWIVAWIGEETGNKTGIYFQRFDASGAKVGDEVLASTITTGKDWDPSVTVLANGGWVVVWSHVDAFSYSDTFAQVFDASGNKVDGEIRVNVTAEGPQDSPAVTAHADGSWTVTWTGRGPGVDWDGVFQRTFRLAEGNVPTAITGTLNWTEGASGSVGTLEATDVEDTLGFKWLLVDDAGGRFKIDANTGEVSVANKVLLDYEQASSHQITVQVTDTDGNFFTEVLTTTGIDVDKEVLTLSSRADKVFGGAKADTFNAGSGDDTIRGGGGKDVLDGGKGRDTLDYSDKTKSVEVALSTSKAVTVKVDGKAEDTIRGFEHVLGGSKSDKLSGDEAGNALEGNGGQDRLSGGQGRDTLFGGAARDVLAGNTSGVLDDGARDTFKYAKVADSRAATDLRDTIYGYFNGGGSTGDKIDLSLVFTGNPDSSVFKFIGSAAFASDHPGRVRVTGGSGADHVIHVNTDNDASDEMTILVHSNRHTFVAGDFML